MCSGPGCDQSASADFCGRTPFPSTCRRQHLPANCTATSLTGPLCSGLAFSHRLWLKTWLRGTEGESHLERNQCSDEKGNCVGMIEPAKAREACVAKFNRGGLSEQAGALALATKGPALLRLGFYQIWTKWGKCLSFFCLLRHQESRQAQTITPEMFWSPKPRQRIYLGFSM